MECAAFTMVYCVPEGLACCAEMKSCKPRLCPYRLHLSSTDDTRGTQAFPKGLNAGSTSQGQATANSRTHFSRHFSRFSDRFRLLRTRKGFCVVSVRSCVSFSFLLFLPAPENHSLLRTETATFHKQLQNHTGLACVQQFLSLRILTAHPQGPKRWQEVAPMVAVRGSQTSGNPQRRLHFFLSLMSFIFSRSFSFRRNPGCPICQSLTSMAIPTTNIKCFLTYG